ncbi:MAG TPA: hypothetical protein VMF89_05025, partial [Polyangiales bacterium]|nr:hypothetical protein [Polyangiales bacterium]
MSSKNSTMPSTTTTPTLGAPPPDPVHERALLDTSVVIDYPASAVAAQASTAAVSTITLAELSYGLHTADPLLNAAREQR